MQVIGTSVMQPNCPYFFMKILLIHLNFGSLIFVSNTTYKQFIRTVQSMNRNPRNRVSRVNNSFSDKFYSRQYYIWVRYIALELLSRAMRVGCTEQLLHTYDLLDPFEGLQGKFEAWERAMGSKGLRVDVLQRKRMINNEKARKARKERTFSYAVCRKSAGSSFNLCQFCK